MAKINPYINIFIAHTPEDGEILIFLYKHLSILELSGFVRFWYDDYILPGENKNKKKEEALLRAEFILLLISSDFINSTFYKYQLSKLLATNKHIIPVIARYCSWKMDERIRDLKELPLNGIPITSESDKRKWDKSCQEVAEVLSSLIQAYRDKGDSFIKHYHNELQKTKPPLKLSNTFEWNIPPPILDNTISSLVFERIEKHLRNNAFLQADIETSELLLQYLKKSRYAINYNWSEFPINILFHVDKIWRKYSNNTFGWSIQYGIWKENYHYDKTNSYLFLSFAQKVGWTQSENSNRLRYNYKTLNFSQKTFRGHLPTSRFMLHEIGIGWAKKWENNFVGIMKIINSSI